MKVVIICNHFPPVIDGVGDYSYRLAREFIRHGYQVSILCAAHPKLEEQHSQWSVYPLVKKWSTRNIPLLVRKILTIKPKAVLFQYVPYTYHPWGTPFWSVIFFLMLRLLGIKSLVTFHEISIKIKKPLSLKNAFVGISQRIISRFICLLSHHIVTSNTFYRNKLWPFQYKVGVVPIGSNIDPFQVSESSINTLKRKFKNRQVIATFGNRDHHHVIEAFAKVRRRYDNTHLLILGYLPESKKQKLHALAEHWQLVDRITLTGFLSGEEIFAHLKSADVFLLIEDHAGISCKSGSLAAAFAAGLPIIGNKGTLTDTIFQHQWNVHLCETNNIHSYVKAVEKVLADAEYAYMLSRNAKSTFDKHLAWESIFRKYMKAF